MFLVVNNLTDTWIKCEGKKWISFIKEKVQMKNINLIDQSFLDKPVHMLSLNTKIVLPAIQRVFA